MCTNPLPAASYRSDFISHQQVAATMIKTLIWLLPLTSLSASAFTALQCGPFDLKADQKGTVTVNGNSAEINSTTFLKAKDDYDNVKLHWRVKNAKAPGMIDMDLVTREGKSLLDAEIVRTSQSQIRIRGSYDCEKK